MKVRCVKSKTTMFKVGKEYNRMDTKTVIDSTGTPCIMHQYGTEHGSTVYLSAASTAAVFVPVKTKKKGGKRDDKKVQS